MTIIPERLQTPLTDVHFFVESTRETVSQLEVCKRVPSFSRLSIKDKEKVMICLEKGGEILFLSENRPDGRRPVKFLRHKKFGYPLPTKEYDFPVEAEVSLNNAKGSAMVKTTDTPESLRKKAEELLKAADEAEVRRNNSDSINKLLAPIKLELSQAVGSVQRKTDELIDAVDILNRAMQKLRDL